MPSDIFRDTWVRYLGYANEVGEAFRPMVPPRLVAYSYGVAFAYVFADTADKTAKMIRLLIGFWDMLLESKRCRERPDTGHVNEQADGRPRSVAIAAGDAILWQTFASVIIPGYTIFRISRFTQRSLCSVRALPSVAVKTLSVGIALACIPIIVTPIDHVVNVGMDLTYRKYFKVPSST